VEFCQGLSGTFERALGEKHVQQVIVISFEDHRHPHDLFSPDEYRKREMVCIERKANHESRKRIAVAVETVYLIQQTRTV
jgi:uncharacterized protein (DUF1330 family)